VPARGTTRWQHAIIQKKVINLDRGGTYVVCAWDTCEKNGYESHKVVEREHKAGREPHTITYVFCTDRHKQYWLASIRPGNNNNLPAGYKRSII
jgi:hypothetical protein